MTSKHTLGPWEVIGSSGNHAVYALRHGLLAAIRYLGNSPQAEAEQTANARLMAASPIMLEALRALLAAFPGQHQTLTDAQHAAWLKACEIVTTIDGE